MLMKVIQKRGAWKLTIRTKRHSNSASEITIRALTAIVDSLHGQCQFSERRVSPDLMRYGNEPFWYQFDDLVAQRTDVVHVANDAIY